MRPEFKIWIGQARSWLPAVAVALLITLAFGWAQFSFDGLRDTDSYFHTRAAYELSQSGVVKQFPQTQFSTWKERYSDKDLLFHAYLIPFQLIHGNPSDLLTPGKWAAVTLALIFYLCFAFALRTLGARYVPLWMILLFVADAPLLYVFLPVRPGILGLCFIVVEIALILRQRTLALAIVGALHAWSHSSFPLLPLLALAAWMAHRLRGEPFSHRVLGAAFLGPLFAIVVHPSFPNSIFLAWDQTIEVARSVWIGRPEVPQFLFGSELLPTKTNYILGTFPAFLPAAAALVIFLAFPQRRLSTVGLGLVLMTALLLATGFLSERFLRFFYPCVVLLGARLWSELAAGKSVTELIQRQRMAFSAALALVVFCLLAGLSDGSVWSLKRQVQSLTTPESQRPGVEFLAQHAAPHELVYHNFWWEFSVLYHYRPDGRYVVALDPVFFYRQDPELFRKSLDAYAGRTQDLYRVLKEDFGATWVFLPKATRYHPFFDLMRRDQRFRKMYEDSVVVIARLV